MDRQAFREELHRVLRDILLERMQQHFDRRFEAYQQLCRYISALDRKDDDPALISEGFSGILGSIEDGLNKENPNELVSDYLSAVDQLVTTFPEETIWEQDEERFTIQDGDSLLVSVGKSGKRVGRSVSYGWHQATKKAATLFNTSINGWEPWKQTVPLQCLVKFHLQDEEIVKDWIVVLERIRLKIITQIEDLLVNYIQSDGEIALVEFADSLREVLDTKSVALSQQLLEAMNKMESEIYWKVKKAGTIERSSSFYDEKRLSSARNQFEQQLGKISDQWIQTQKLLLDRSRNVLRFINLRSEIDEQSQKIVVDFQSIYQEKLVQPLNDLSRLLTNAIERVGKKTSTDAVIDTKNRLSTFVKERLDTPIQNLLDNQVFSRKAEHFFEDLLMNANQLPQQTSLIFDSELESNPPLINQKEVEWRQLVIRALRERLINPLQPSQQKYEDYLSLVLQEVQEVEDIIEVNLESALTAQQEHSDEGGEDPSKIAREALKRISSTVKELHSQALEKSLAIEKVVDEGVAQFSKSLLTLLHEGDAKQLQLLNAKYKVKERTKDWRTLLDSRWVRLQDRLMLWFRFGWKKSKKYGSNIRTVAGFKDQAVEESKRADIATYLSETDQKIKELPYIYRRLFDFQALGDERFYVPASEATMIFKKAFEQWHQLFAATFAIIGEKGSGKSTFLNLIRKSELAQEDVTQIDLHDTIWAETELVEQLAASLNFSSIQSVSDIIEALKSSGNRKVVIVEGVQNCFVRNINGYEAIEKLCYLISETSDQVFWAISCSKYAWNFLNKTVQISEYFSHIAMSDTLNADQIKSVILNRHRASGYTLIFEPGNETLKSRAYRKLQDQEEQVQEHLQKNYFQELTELADGNASVAMIFWIRSIWTFDDTYFYIQPLEIKSIEMIEELNPQVLFALAAFVLHDTLSDEDLSMVLNMTLEESRLLINRLHSRGLLIRQENMYAINHLMYRQIVRVLKERNIIHLV